MRYWKQCTNGNAEEEEDESKVEDSEESKTDWKTEALEGDVQEFPSIQAKIKNMEEEAKKVSTPRGMFEVPDVKSKMRQGAPAAGWMEARTKLQKQFDTLITKTSAKMAKYGNIHVIERESPSKESQNGEDKTA